MKNQQPHTRTNPLTGEKVLVSPHRTKRPWQGREEEQSSKPREEYDPDCYLCPGNTRAGGIKNPGYTETFVFTNDFPALLPQTEEERIDEDGLFLGRSERGICKVICFSPRHDLSLSRMTPGEIKSVIETWTEEYTGIGSEPFINYVQIFENKGKIMGCSNPHPHGQIWSNEHIPHIPMLETERQLQYTDVHDACLLCTYLRFELEKKERILLENETCIALVPYWAVWPYETMILLKRHIRSLPSLTGEEQSGLASIMRELGIMYDNLFKTEFPYSMGIHQQPTDNQDYGSWHLHIHYYPPLLRSATVRKFMVGYELLGAPQRDFTPEHAAGQLRSLPREHYLDHPRQSIV